MLIDNNQICKRCGHGHIKGSHRDAQFCAFCGAQRVVVGVRRKSVSRKRRSFGKKRRRRFILSQLEISPFCKYCGKRLDRDSASVDHIIPLSKKGKDDESNYALACVPCNTKKGSRLV